MPLVRKMISWLTYHPTCNEIARALATDYLAEFSVQGVRFSRLNNDDSIVILGEYGFADSAEWSDRVIASSEWRARETEAAKVLKGERQMRWCDNSTIYVETLMEHGVAHGHLMVAFNQGIADEDMRRVAERIQDLSIPLALYLSFLNPPFAGSAGGPSSRALGSTEVGAGQLSQRQILILRGMVEGKTNHELATELGFSVSTIRHETMRIYQALAVSDRKEAAKKALMLSLI